MTVCSVQIRGLSMRASLVIGSAILGTVFSSHRECTAQQSPTSPAKSTQLVVNAGNVGALSISLSPDGKFFAVPDGNSVDLWDVEKGRRIRTLTGPKTFVFHAAMSRDGRQVAASTSEVGTGEIYVWDSETGLLKAKLRVTATRNFGSGIPYSSTHALTFTKDGNRIIAVGSFNSRTSRRFQISTETVRIIDVSTGTIVRSVETENLYTSQANSVDLSPDGKLFAVGYSSGITHFYDLDGKLVRATNSPTDKGQVKAITFAPDGYLIAQAIEDYGKKRTNVEIWEVRTGKLIRSVAADHEGERVGISWSPDARAIAIRGHSGLQIWNVRTGEIEKQNVSLAAAGSAVRYIPDGSALVASGRPTVLVDAKTMQIITKFGESMGSLVEGTTASSREVVVSVAPCSTYAVNTFTGSIKKHLVRDIDDGLCPIEAVSADGKRFAHSVILKTERNVGRLLYSDLATGTAVKTLTTKASGLPSFSSDGRMVAVDVGTAIDVFDVESGAIVRSVPGKPSHLTYALSPDGKRLVAVENAPPLNPIYVWDLPSGRLSQLAQMNTSTGGAVPFKLVFSPDSRFVVAAGTRSSQYAFDYWAVDKPQLLRRVTIPENNTEHFGGVAFSPDGGKILIGSWDAQMRLWDLKSGELLRTYIGHVAAPLRTSFAAEGHRIASAGSDAVKIWNTETGEALASVYITANGEWLEVTPEGFFDASSAKAARLLSVVRGFEVSSIDQFYNALYRPDLVREKLAGDPDGKVKAAAAKLDLDKMMASGSAPKVAITSPAAGTSSATDEVVVEATVSDQGGGIGKVEWRVNGVTSGIETRGLERVESTASAGRSLTVKRTLALELGENRIEVLAYNNKDLIASEPASVAVKWDGEKTATPPKLYVMAVGVNDYYDSRLRLSYAVPDATAIAEGFRKAGTGLYAAVDVTTVLDKDVTIANLDKVFTELGKKAQPRDVFVFFLAGHGKTKNGKYYFLPRDFRYEDEDSIERAGMDQDKFQAWFAKIPARKSILLYDTCESGSLIGTKARGSDIDERLGALNRMTRATGRTFLTATTDDAPALEGYRGHGVFTYALLDALDHADINKNGLIEVSELADYIDQKVPDLSFEAFKLRQIPQRNIVGSNFVLTNKMFVLAATNGAPSANTAKDKESILAKPLNSETAANPTKATHVVVTSSPMDVFESVAPEGPKGMALQKLTMGTPVVVIKSSNGWDLIAKDGKLLGYVAHAGLAPVQ